MPPAIFPSDSLDTMDVRYLNYSNAPILSPLKKSLKIEMYNDIHFDKPPSTKSESKDTFNCQLDKIALKSHSMPAFLTIKEMFKEFGTDMDNLRPTENRLKDVNSCQHTDIVASQSKLFFIKYTPEKNSSTLVSYTSRP